MKSRDFCFWLQGYFELAAGKDELTAEQANTIRNHLALVFKHEIDPPMGGATVQETLNAIRGPSTHNGGKVTMRC